MLAVALALGSSLTWGVSDFLGGLKSRALPILGALLCSQGSALAILAAVVLGGGTGPPDGGFLVAGALGGVGEAIGTAALYRGLAAGTMSVVAPVAATAPMIPVVVGAARGEVPGISQGIGIVAAVAGIVLVARSDSSTVKHKARTAQTVRSIGFGLLAAMGFGGSFVGTDIAAEADVPWALLIARVVTVGVFLAAAMVMHAPVAVPTGQLPILVLIGILVLGADTLYALATTQGLLGVVAVLSSLFPVVTIFLARVVLKERLQRPQQAGALLCLTGSVLVSAGSWTGRRRPSYRRVSPPSMDALGV